MWFWTGIWIWYGGRLFELKTGAHMSVTHRKGFHRSEGITWNEITCCIHTCSRRRWVTPTCTAAKLWESRTYIWTKPWTYLMQQDICPICMMYCRGNVGTHCWTPSRVVFLYHDTPSSYQILCPPCQQFIGCPATQLIDVFSQASSLKMTILF